MAKVRLPIKFVSSDGEQFVHLVRLEPIGALVEMSPDSVIVGKEYTLHISMPEPIDKDLECRVVAVKTYMHVNKNSKPDVPKGMTADAYESTGEAKLEGIVEFHFRRLSFSTKQAIRSFLSSL